VLRATAIRHAVPWLDLTCYSGLLGWHRGRQPRHGGGIDANIFCHSAAAKNEGARCNGRIYILLLPPNSITPQKYYILNRIPNMPNKFQLLFFGWSAVQSGHGTKEIKE
jgi:hypothetical protein